MSAAARLSERMAEHLVDGRLPVGDDEWSETALAAAESLAAFHSEEAARNLGRTDAFLAHRMAAATIREVVAAGRVLALRMTEVDR